MLKKIRNFIETVIFLIALLQAAFGWYLLARDWCQEVMFQVKRRSNPNLTRFWYKN